VPASVADTYFDEVARVALALGARDVPRSEREVRAYFAAQRPQLRYDARSREVLDVLAHMRLPVPMAGLSRDVFLGAGAALLPDWAATMLRRTSAQSLHAQVSARALAAIAPLFRAALTDGIAGRARARVSRPHALP
jgi:uncharacterized protein (DUF2236 family)